MPVPGTSTKVSLLCLFLITRQLPVEMQCSKRCLFARIILLDAVAAKQKAPFAAVCREAGAYNIVESESDPLTRRPVDLF